MIRLPITRADGMGSSGGCRAPRACATLAPVKVFLSYAERDEKLAQSIRVELEKGGLMVWDASAKLAPGDNWALELGKALREADAMVVLLSPAALASDHVKREIEYAWESHASRGGSCRWWSAPSRRYPGSSKR